MGQAALAGLSVELYHLRKVMASLQKIHDQCKRDRAIAICDQYAINTRSICDQYAILTVALLVA
jgi:hypothetical protein